MIHALMRVVGIRKKSIKKCKTLGGSQNDAGISVSKPIAKWSEGIDSQVDILSHGKTAVPLRRRALLLLPQLQPSPMALRARRLRKTLRLRSGVQRGEGLDSRKPQSRV